MSFTCNICGKRHEGWPALSFDAPYNYHVLSDEDRSTTGYLDSDSCTIKRLKQTDRFIRCTLLQKVNEHCEDLNYGLWVSLSEKSFNDYKENFNNENHEAGYFGYISNLLPDYDSTLNIPMNVYIQRGTTRPLVAPHTDIDHSFAKDYFDGISKQIAEKRISAITG